MRRARASASAGGARNPVASSMTSSVVPPTAVATTGAPAAIASITALGNPSLSEADCDVESGGDQCGVIAGAQQMHPVIDADSRGLLLDLAPERAVPDQQEMRFWFDSRDAAGGLDEVTMPFDLLQPRDEADQFRAFVQIQLSQQRRAPFRAAAAFQDHALDGGAQAVVDDDDLLRRDMAAGQ